MASIKCVKIEHSQFHSILILAMVTMLSLRTVPLCQCNADDVAIVLHLGVRPAWHNEQDGRREREEDSKLLQEPEKKVVELPFRSPS